MDRRGQDDGRVHGYVYRDRLGHQVRTRGYIRRADGHHSCCWAHRSGAGAFRKETEDGAGEDEFRDGEWILDGAGFGFAAMRLNVGSSLRSCAEP